MDISRSEVITCLMWTGNQGLTRLGHTEYATGKLGEHEARRVARTQIHEWMQRWKECGTWRLRNSAILVLSGSAGWREVTPTPWHYLVSDSWLCKLRFVLSWARCLWILIIKPSSRVRLRWANTHKTLRMVLFIGSTSQKHMLAATLSVVYYHFHEFFIIWGIILKLKDSETHLCQPTESDGT